ncbi:MAG: hypothetical protein M0006_10205 [Magnetospirillum sp.]|nr:hypothetical protein [Magnetospirillum sp.]
MNKHLITRLARLEIGAANLEPPEPVPAVIVGIGETAEAAAARHGIPNDYAGRLIVLRAVDARRPQEPHSSGPHQFDQLA